MTPNRQNKGKNTSVDILVHYPCKNNKFSLRSTKSASEINQSSDLSHSNRLRPRISEGILFRILTNAI